MLKRSLFVILCFLAAGAAGTSNGQTISGSIGSGSVARGATARGVVTINIPAGLHVNSNRPSSEYSIPTTVRLSSSGVKLSAVSYPRGHSRKFQFSESPINVYEGRVSFPFSVNVPSAFSGSTVRVRAIVRYQACTDEVCYPPKTKEVTITARVR